LRRGGAEIKIAVDSDNMPTSFSRGSGDINDYATTTSVKSMTSQNANGYNTELLNPGSGNGRIYFVDRVSAFNDWMVIHNHRL